MRFFAIFLRRTSYMKPNLCSEKSAGNLGESYQHYQYHVPGPYLLYTLLKTWPEADKHCKDQKGYLATIPRKEVNDMLKTQMQIKYVNCCD